MQMEIKLSHIQRRNLNRMRNNFVLFAKNCLFIKTKVGDKIVPLKLNKSQLRFCRQIETARRESKYNSVRLVVLKARQMGFSTVTEAYFFWDTYFHHARNSFIMAHDGDSTRNIFEMVKRYYDCIPDGVPKPSLKKNNEKALIFDETDCYFRIGTAGSGGVGRSQTNQNLHLSEAGFFLKADEVAGAIMQTVPMEGSNVIIESTANGVGGFFYDKVMEGLEPNSPWTTVFYAWHEFDEYSSTAPDDFVPDAEERELIELYDCTFDQLQWRREKIEQDFKKSPHIFKQEYPSSIEEAFLSTQNGLIQGIYLSRARKSDIRDPEAPTIIGVDPARSGDRTVICVRRGREIREILIYEQMESVELAQICGTLIEEYKAEACFIDPGCGWGTIDILHRRRYADKVFAVPFNSRPINKKMYSNKRTEIYGTMRDWFMQPGGVRIPDSDMVVRDLGVTPDFTRNAAQQWVMAPKDEIKKINSGKSPDISDAIALTFSDIRVNIDRQEGNKIKVIKSKRRS